MTQVRGGARSHERPAFTLLELLLAMAIAAVLLAILGFAIDLHLRALQSSRDEVEEAQLARAILRRMADDLRGTVRHEPVEALGPKGATPGAAEGELGDQGGQSPTPVQPLEPEDADSGDDDAESETETALAGSTPGLYGTQYELQVDVSRLPRPDEYAILAPGDEFGPAASDMKTVSWFVRGGSVAADTGMTDELTGAAGLVRHEMDRAASLWAAEQGGLSPRDLPPMAPEVVAIELGYFDGFEWLSEWDSEEEGGLPLAVRIALALAPPGSQPGGALSADAASPGGESTIYTLVVHLPAAEPIEDATSSGDSTEEEEESSQQSSSASPETTQPPTSP